MKTDTTFNRRAGDTMKMIVASVYRLKSIAYIHCWAAFLAALILWQPAARAAAPDLTSGTTRFTIDRTSTYNLGPTGMRGWIYNRPAYGFTTGDTGTMTEDQPWQILVTTVGTGTPAVGIIQVDDVILGVKAGGGTVDPFTNDSRKALGREIGEAEAGDGVLSLLINRYGVPTNQTYTIQLGLTGLAYSATAPYNCPKSARILQDIYKVISNKTFNVDDLGLNFTLGMAYMAMGITNNALRNFARGLPAKSTWNGNVYPTWPEVYQLLFLTEYHLFTGDTNVLPYLTRLTGTVVSNGSMHSTYNHEHIKWWPWNTNGVRPTSAGYGPMNALTLPANLSLILAQKCGVTNAEVADMIFRGSRFLSFYAGKGSFPYGEHEPWYYHSSNAKNEMGALLFSQLDNRRAETEHFTRMAVAAYRGRELGHTGCGWQFLWNAAGVNVGGTNALVEYIKRIRWHLDLVRRSDGSFTYDGQEQYGGSQGVNDYWQDTAYYRTFNMSAVYALTFSLPSRRLYFTGRNANPSNVLSSAALSNALWAGEFKYARSGFTTNQLLSYFSEWDPIVRVHAAEELAVRPGSNTLVAGLITMTTNADARVREAACLALGLIKNTTALSALAARLSDTDLWVRAKAAAALNLFGSAASLQCAVMMTAYTNNATDSSVITDADPIQTANGLLAEPIFYHNATTAIGVNTNLLYDALRVGLQMPSGQWRHKMKEFVRDRLTWEHVQTLAPELVAACEKSAPADPMNGGGYRAYACLALAKYRVEEAIPLAMIINESADWGSMDHTYLIEDNNFVTPYIISNYYRGAVPEVVPELIAWSNVLWTYWMASQRDRATQHVARINSAIDRIVNDPSPPALNYFKKFTMLSAIPTSFTLPETNVAMKTFVVDTDGGVPHYTWRRMSGPGDVTFVPNASTASSNTTATFAEPGTYVIQARVFDSSINDWMLWYTNTFENGNLTTNLNLKTYTNGFLAVTTNLTITVYGVPFVNITNANYIATDFAQVLIGGTNNGAVVGGMRVVSMTGPTTNYMGSIAATTPWTIMVSNLAQNVTNIVIVSGTNGMGMATNDTIQIFRTPLPYLQITNTPAGVVSVASTTTNWMIGGTNTAMVVGGLTWSNAAIAGLGGRLSPASGNWNTNIQVVMGFNPITFWGTNYLGTVTNDTYVVIVGTPPMIDITNVATTSTISVPSTTTQQPVAGTNNLAVVGNLRWTNMVNSLPVGGAALPLTNWSFMVNLSNGLNKIWVRGTNVAGNYVGDTVVVYRATAPYVNITNDTITVPMGVGQTEIGGTNNAGVVGMMKLASVAGGTTNFTAWLAATTPWTVVVGNLAPNATNYVTMTVTNDMDETASDTVQIYRRPIACVDITNTSGGIVVVPGTTTMWRVVGTNSLRIVGGMVWTNSLGGDGTVDATPGTWWFDTPITSGFNIITVYGTNTAGDTASDSIVVMTGLGWSYAPWTGDADSGITNAYPYHVAVNLGGTSQIVNNVSFQASALSGTNFGIGGAVIVYPNDPNNVASVLAANFIFNAATRTVTLSNLQPNVLYKTTFYSVGFDATGRVQTFAVGSDTLVLDQDIYGDNNGVQISHLRPADASGIITYTITQTGGGGTFHMYALATAVLGSAQGADMLTFGPGAVINGTNVSWTLPYGTDATNLAPTYQMSPGAVCNKASGSTNDFTMPVPYTVVSIDGMVTNVYTVTVVVTPGRTEKEILTFGIPGYTGVISGTEIYLSVPYGTDITNLAPTYTISPLATCTPASGSPDDFTVPVPYTVTAQDQSSNIYTVYVTVRPEQIWPITNGVMVWLKGGGIDVGNPNQVRSVGTNVYVKQWQDQSGNGQHATQATDTNQPEYLAGNFNGHPTVAWDGAVAGKFLRGPTSATIKTVFFVCKVDTNVSGLDSMFCASPDQDSKTIQGDLNKWWAGYGGTYFESGNTNATRINGAATYYHGRQWHILRMVSASPSSFTYQLGQRAYSRYFNGRIAEFIAYDHALLPDEVSGIEMYLSNKYWIAAAHVEITNIAGLVSHTNDTQDISGTNNEYTVGGMWWTNSLGGGTVIDPGLGYWSFTAPVYPGNNVITVYGTNQIGFVVSHCVTVNYAVTPFVNITNDNFTTSMGASAAMIGGTNNSGPIGGMHLVSRTGATTNYTCAVPAALSWTAVVSNLVGGVTNIVTVTATNGISQTASDTIEIYRDPVGVVDITNVAGLIATTAGTQYLAGTNNVHVVGGMWWTNTLGGGGTLDPAPGTWNFTTDLYPGTNVITVYCTNAVGYVFSDTVTVVATPQWPLYRGLNLWLDAAQVAGLTNGQQVDTWADMSGQSNNAIRQGTSSNGFPQYVTNALSMYPALRFSGIDKMAVNLSFLASNSYTIFAVEGKRSASSSLYLLGMQTAALNQGLHFGYRSNAGFTLAQYANDLDYNNASLAYTSQVFRRWAGRLDKSSGHSIYLNGAAVATNTNTTPFSTANNGFVGVGFNDSIYYNGDIIEIIVYDRALVASEIAEVDRYLWHKYWGTLAAIDITNSGSFVTHTNATQYIAGTNNVYTVGGMWWTNTMGGGGLLNPATGSWAFTAAIQPGNNIITIHGTNVLGVPASDCVTVNYAVTPFVDITNGNFTVSMGVSTARIGGTNNLGTIGSMQLASVTGGTTNYLCDIPAAPSWSVVISNLVDGMTNVVTVTGTNGVGQTAGDTIQIYRRPIAFVDITNLTGLVDTVDTTQYIAGTNNTSVAGMWWTNTLGGGSTLNPAAGNWSFTAGLTPGTNIITVYGTNTGGDVSSDTVSVRILPQWPIFNGMTLWLKGDGINTGDTSQVRIVDTNAYVKYWPDQSGNGQNASQADPTNQPEYLAESLNGYPTLYWDGSITNKSMNGPGNTTIKTIFFVCKVDTNRTTYDGILCQSPNQDNQNIRGNANYWRAYGVNAQDFCYTGSVYVNSTITNLHNYQWHILREVAGPTPSFTYQLGQRAYLRYFDGRIAEVIAYNRKLLDGEAMLVEQYLSNKYFNTPLCVKTTNVTSSVIVTSGTEQYLAGTNSPSIVDMWWTNTLGGGGTLDAAPGTWSFTVPLGVGINNVVVRGSNDAGVITYDIVTVTRVRLPYINVTNADFAVGMETSTAQIGGTNATGSVVGTMRMVSVADGVTNYQTTIAAASPWTATVSNLVIGATNYVTVAGTNVLGDATSDTVLIYRMPQLGYVDIVNMTGTVSVTHDTQYYIGGTNTPAILGMWWTNSLGGGGTLDAGPCAFGFLTPLAYGSNVITVRGSNMYGDTASDTVTILKKEESWTYSPWTCDADSGITNAYSYHVAVNFGSTGVYVNSVLFQGNATSGPNFGVNVPAAILINDANNVTGSLAHDFIYSASPRIVTISNLVPNARYQITFFSVAYDPAGRSQTFATASDTMVLDQDIYGNNNGIKISYAFDGPANGVKQFTITQVGIGTFHMYALAVARGVPTTKPFVDITNVTGIVNVPMTTTNQYIAGTNTSIAVGMWWTNSTGGGGTIAPAPGNWGFNVPVSQGVDNVIFVSGTNSAGLAYTDPLVIRFVRPPFVNITNNDFVVGMETSTARIGGTNNAGWVVGRMQLVSVTGGVTNYQATISAAPSWTAMVSNLVIGTTNYVTMTGTNVLGQAASDTIVIYRMSQLGYVDIVNATGTVSVLYDMQYYLSGTNTPTISGMSWNNSLGGGGTLDSGPGSFGFFTPLVYGSNVITVRGTNMYGDTASDTVTILKRGSWSYAPWTSDGDSGITNAYAYPVAVNFGSTATYVNTVLFEGNATAGFNFAVGGTISTINGDSNSNSSSLASDFIYNGFPRTVTLSYLEPNERYQATFYSVGFEAAGRTQAFTSASDTLVLDPDFYGDNNGIKVMYTFDAPQNGVQQFSMTPLKPGYSFHLYALAVALTPKPCVDITNANFAVNASTAAIGGTNTAVVGTMTLASMTGTTTNYVASIGATPSWTAVVSNLVIGATNVVTVTATNVTGETVSDTVQIYRPLGDPNALLSLSAGRAADYGQVLLSWSNGVATVLACTNRTYSTNEADWFVLSSDVSTPWTHTAASNFPSVYYRIVNGIYTSTYAVGKYDVQIAAGSVAWLSFPFGVQSGCDIVAEWFGQQLEVRPYTAFNFPTLQRQNTPGGTIEVNDYYFDDFDTGETNWFPNHPVVANAGYVIFLPQDHGGVKVTGIGMVQTNNVTMQIPYNSIPWVGLAYDVVMDMRQCGLTNMLQPPRLYSSFNYDFVDSQQTPGGPVWYAEYYLDNWGGGTVDFFPNMTGADMLEPGKGYLLFFSTGRAGTGTWQCARPY